MEIKNYWRKSITDTKEYCLGTDLSHHNILDLEACGRQEFIFLKASEGRSYIDNKMNVYLTQLANKYHFAQIPFIGFYHFAHPELNTPLGESRFYLDVIKNHIGNCIPILDYEDKALRIKNSENWALEWLNDVRAKTGSTPVFYVQASALKNYPTILANYPVWVACYSEDSRKGKYKREIEQSTFIQITSHPFDVDIFKGSPNNLAELIQGGK